MDNYQNDNKPTNGIAIINLLLLVIFMGIIVAGCTLSVDKISPQENSLSTTNMMRFINLSLQPNNKTHSILPKTHSMVLNNKSLAQKKPDSTNFYNASLDDKKKAMLGMFFVMLKKG